VATARRTARARGPVVVDVIRAKKVMRIVKACWFLILLAELVHPAFPAIRPSFRLDYSSWHATHIVLAITTPEDGTFKVVESWKGDLRVGDRIVIPELRPEPNAVPISRYPKEGGIAEQIPREPAGSSVFLFLKSSADGQVPTIKTDKRRGWGASDIMDTMKASVVWADGDQLYCFTQVINPGPSVLSALRFSEQSLRNRVAEIDGIQRNLMAALAAKDGQERAEHLKPYLRSDVFPAQQFALEELGKCGPSAVRTILGTLDNPAFADEASELVVALVKAGGASVGEELNNRLQRDFAFWKSTGPTLSPGWWNADPRIHTRLRDRYAQTYQLIVGLEQTRYSASLNTAIQLRDFWRSLPQLNDPSGLDQIVAECDKLVRQLQAN
jgi:hypothetical protein